VPTEPVIPTVDLADLDRPEHRARALATLREGFGTGALVHVARHDHRLARTRGAT